MLFHGRASSFHSEEFYFFATMKEIRFFTGKQGALFFPMIVLRNDGRVRVFAVMEGFVFHYDGRARLFSQLWTSFDLSQ